jgi:integrase
MPLCKKIPSYCLHRPSGQARVIIDGKHVYLGIYGSAQSREQYARLLAERFKPGGAAPVAPFPQHGFPDLSINELLVRYLEFATGYYVKNGRPTGEASNLKDAMRPLRALYSHSLAKNFGPKSLTRVRQYMIDVENLSRGVINNRIDRIRRIFKWAVSEELIAPSVHEALRAVSGLRFGRSAAREAEPVGPVPDEWVNATLEFLPPQIADMVCLQRLTGMRAGDLVRMRGCEIDRRNDVWVYEPSDHKMRHRNRRHCIQLGPQAKTILMRYLDRPPEAFLFSPREVMEWRKLQRRLKPSTRKTPVYPSELRRIQREKEARRRRIPKCRPGEHYTTCTYNLAIRYGIQQARRAGVEIPSWHSHQLRKARGSEVRRQFGLEGAQLILDHARADVSQLYAERDLARAQAIARQTG